MIKSWFNNCTVVLTGASSGIGFELAKLLISEHNCTVYAVARNIEKLNNVKQELGEQYIPFPFDVSDASKWDSLYNELYNTDRDLRLVINNAGYFPVIKKAIDSEKDAIDTINVNYLPSVYSLKLSKLFKNKYQCGMAFISSAASLLTIGGTSTYSASKSALKCFVESLIVEEKFYACNIMPGFVATDLFSSQKSSSKELKFIKKFSMPTVKCARKIINSLRKRKQRVVLGSDAKFMSFISRLMPNLSTKLMAKIIKTARLEMFDNAFDD